MDNYWSDIRREFLEIDDVLTRKAYPMSEIHFGYSRPVKSDSVRRRTLGPLLAFWRSQPKCRLDTESDSFLAEEVDLLSTVSSFVIFRIFDDALLTILERTIDETSQAISHGALAANPLYPW